MTITKAMMKLRHVMKLRHRSIWFPLNLTSPSHIMLCDAETFYRTAELAILIGTNRTRKTPDPNRLGEMRLSIEGKLRILFMKWGIYGFGNFPCEKRFDSTFFVFSMESWIISLFCVVSIGQKLDEILWRSTGFTGGGGGGSPKYH